MGTEFEDALNEITGASTGAAPGREQEQAAPAESNVFDQSLSEKVQEATLSPDKSHDTPEPGGSRER